MILLIVCFPGTGWSSNPLILWRSDDLVQTQAGDEILGAENKLELITKALNQVNTITIYELTLYIYYSFLFSIPLFHWRNWNWRKKKSTVVSKVLGGCICYIVCQQSLKCSRCWWWHTLALYLVMFFSVN
jgi:hypothetical protein